MLMKSVRLACSQTLYFFFKVRRTRVIKKTKTAGDLLTFLARSPMFSKRTKRKIKQHLCTG